MNRRNNHRQQRFMGIPTTALKYILHTLICSCLLYSKFWPYEYVLISISVNIDLWSSSSEFMFNWQMYTRNGNVTLNVESQLLENSEKLDQILSKKEVFDIRNMGDQAALASIMTKSKTAPLTHDDLMKAVQSTTEDTLDSFMISNDKTKALQEKKNLDEFLELLHDEKMELQGKLS